MLLPVTDLWVGADLLVTLDSLENTVTGAQITGATVTFTLTKVPNGAIPLATSISMPYVTGTPSKYQGTLVNAANILDGVPYYLYVVAQYSGLKLPFRQLRKGAWAPGR